jgi:hypothetical protein
MQVQRAATMADYLGVLRENPQEAQALFANLLISVTTFFRDASAFDKLAALVIPRVFQDKGASDTIRAWVPGCATGEEAHSIAMLLLEEAGRHEIRCGVQVFASDGGVETAQPRDESRGAGNGRRLIEEALPYQFGARTTFAIEQDGVRCTIALPLSGAQTEGIQDGQLAAS